MLFNAKQNKKLFGNLVWKLFGLCSWCKHAFPATENKRLVLGLLAWSCLRDVLMIGMSTIFYLMKNSNY